MNIERPKSKQPMPADAKKVFEGVVFDVYQWDQKLYDGRTTKFEKIKRPDTVVVFPVQDDGKIVLTEQEHPGKEPFIAATGGGVESGEDILAAAKRELLEETGYEAEEFILWDAQQPMGKIDWAVFTFIAKGIKKVAELSLDGGEKVKLMPVTFDEFLEIGTQKNFSEREIVPYLFEAKLIPERREQLRALFSIK